MNLPEPARALGWHLARATAYTLAVGLLLAYASTLVLATGYAVAGNLPWWIPALLLLGMAVPVGVATWWRAGMGRPGSRDRECQCPTISASEILRGELRANVKLGQP